jgi:tRNA-specific 2-thiouridylase
VLALTVIIHNQNFLIINPDIMDERPYKTIEGRIVVGLSGGVDSAVAALLLKRKGYDVHGLFMKNWEEDDEDGYCAAEEDLGAARAVAEKLDIPLDTVNFSSEYWDRVFEYFLGELRAGRTPNPDILCNREIKFQAFLDYALSRGAEKIATGHYACSQRFPDSIQLKRASDCDKDQTYFLHQVSGSALMKTLFPLCRYQKSVVREMALEAGLSNYDRKDSTGICFIGERRFNDFIAKYFPNKPGDILTTDNRKIGEHRGLMFHTIGQRKGLGIGGRKDSAEEPWFVTEKRMEDNTLIVAQGHDNPALYANGLEANSIHWISRTPGESEFNCTARTRHRQQDVPCRVQLDGTSSGIVTFEAPMRAIAPGQSVVFYDEQVCLGGGVIVRAIK